MSNTKVSRPYLQFADGPFGRLTLSCITVYLTRQLSPCVLGDTSFLCQCEQRCRLPPSVQATAVPGARARKAERGNTRVLRGRSLVVADELNRWPYPWGRKAPDFRPEPIRAESDQKIRERHQSLFSFHAFHAGLSLI